MNNVYSVFVYMYSDVDLCLYSLLKNRYTLYTPHFFIAPNFYNLGYKILKSFHSPHIGPQDFELIRVWDSMVYEDECEDGMSLTLSASGNLDASQTRQALYLGGK